MEREDAWKKECLKKISAMQKQLDELRVMIKTKEKGEPSKGDVSEAFHEYTKGFVETPQGRERFEKLLAEEMEKYDNRWRPSQEGESPQEKIETEIEKEGDVVVSEAPLQPISHKDETQEKKKPENLFID